MKHTDLILMLTGIFYTLSFSVLQLYKHLMTNKGKIKHLIISSSLIVIGFIIYFMNLYQKELSLAFLVSPLLFIGLFTITNKFFNNRFHRDIVMPMWGENTGRYDWNDWIFSIIIMVSAVLVPSMMLELIN